MRYTGIKWLLVRSFFGILAVTVLASIITTGAVFYLLQMQGARIPKIEQQVNNLERYAGRHAEGLISGDPRVRGEWKDRVAGANDVRYAVLDASGSPVAGDTTAFPLPLSEEQLTERLNELGVSGQRREETVALFANGQVRGYLLLSYPLANTALSTTQRVEMIAQIVVAALLPVAFLVASALLFAWRVGRKLNEPINELGAAIEKIRRRDLDFTIRYAGENELGDLCRAFEELRAELRESLEREWRQGQEMRDMVAALSHDLRTPATIIQGHVEGLSRTTGKQAERLERYLPILEASSQRMVKLLNDMMLVVNLEQSGFSIHPQPIYLAEELERMAEAYRLRAADHGVSFVLKMDKERWTDTQAVLDIHRFGQILDNLFENALRFTPTGGTITLTSSYEGHELCISVQDTGFGIEPEDLPYVFERFYKGSQNGSRDGKSSGLGLYISKLLIDTQGGKITLRNRADSGCEVMFSLPIDFERPGTVQPAAERNHQ